MHQHPRQHMVRMICPLVRTAEVIQMSGTIPVNRRAWHAGSNLGCFPRDVETIEFVVQHELIAVGE